MNPTRSTPIDLPNNNGAIWSDEARFAPYRILSQTSVVAKLVVADRENYENVHVGHDPRVPIDSLRRRKRPIPDAGKKSVESLETYLVYSQVSRSVESYRWRFIIYRVVPQ